VAISKLNLTMRTNDAIITGDTSKVIPMIGNVVANSIQYSGKDSTTLRLRDLKTKIRILPSKENPTLPSISFEVESKQINLFAQGNRVMTRDAALSISATKNDPQVRRERTNTNNQGNTNRGNNRSERGGERRTDDFVGEDIDIKDAETGALLRQWTVQGTVKSRSCRVVTPYFPLRTRLQNLDLKFTTNEVTLQNLDVRCGSSRLNFTGKIDGIRRALSTGRGLKIEAEIIADTLNLNQLLTAIYNGSAYSESSDAYKNAVTNASDDEHLEQIIQDENERKKVSPLFVVPSNITIDAKLDVKYAKYADLTIDKLTGQLLSRDRCIQLKDLVAQTNVGEIDLTALYATRSKKDITFGIDLEFKDILVEDFIRMTPSIDSLVPMLSSFKGVVNCQVAATAALDTTMNIKLSSLNAACRISGKDMVLLDGKTFSEIAKTLKFKNRDQNLVKRIGVELLVRNNQIEIFPFIMEIDRYKAALSGIHNLDMTFNYHISVLQSPLGFRFGINLKGNLDNIKFGIGKAKYKDTELPTYVTVIDTTRLNLRKQIDNFIRQGVDIARFSQFSTPQIDPTFIEKEYESQTLSVKDSLALYKEGIINTAPKTLLDTVPNGEQPRRQRGGERKN